MKKKFLCILLAFLLALPCLFHSLQVKAVAPTLPFLYTAWDSTVAAYGGLKGLQFGQNASTPDIIGDYTKPYQYQPESIAPLKPSWDSLKTSWIADNFAGIYPALSEEDAKKALDKQWDDFDNAIGLGNIDITSPIYKAFEGWIASLVGTDYIVSSTEQEKLTLESLTFPKVPVCFPNGTIKYTSTSVDTNNSIGIAVKPVSVSGTGDWLVYPAGYVYYQNGRIDCLFVACYYQNDHGYIRTEYKDTVQNPDVSGFASFGTDSQGNAITNTDSVGIPNTDTIIPAETISQFPVNPNDNNDKDNKKIAVLPNVPSLKDNLNNLGNVNGGKLPIKFPDPDPVTGLIPSIPVIGNGGVTINIPVTNNNYQVINNYDQHQDIYNENNSYPTINYNYVNYYINEGAMTYEQFLQALQKYFNVIVYNNETNNYYPSTINNTTNNYYTIQEIIDEEIPPILPPSRIAITDRFPFCLPFDIYKILVLFNAEPKAWEWDVPVPTFKSGGTSTDTYHGEIGHIDYSETMHISLEQWEPVAVVLRVALGVLWLLYLCFLFQKLVH